ncbi:MAG: hypothetical protein AAF487_03235 [Bacteroidota bacterium]
MKKFFFIYMMLCAYSFHAQQTIYDEATVLYKKELRGGIEVHGHGIGLFFTKGYYKSVDNVLEVNVSLVNMKSPNEDRRFNFWDDRARSYIYGKMNHFYLLRPSIGKRQLFAYKDRKSGVEFSYSWAIGPSFGITKPYFLEIAVPIDQSRRILVKEKYDPQEHFLGNIYGRASWFNGFSELKGYVGAYGKLGFNMEFSREQTAIQGIEAGIALDAFPDEIPILADETFSGVVNKNKGLFFSFYARLFLGKKYN